MVPHYDCHVPAWHCHTPVQGDGSSRRVWEDEACLLQGVLKLQGAQVCQRAPQNPDARYAGALLQSLARKLRTPTWLATSAHPCPLSPSP